MQSGLEKLTTWINDHREDIKKWVDGAVEKVKEFVKWADNAAGSLGGWQNVLIGLATLKVGSGIISLAATLANIAASLATISRLGGGALLGLLKNPVKYSGVGSVLGILTNPDELGKDEDLQKRFGTGGLPFMKGHGDSSSGGDLFKTLEERYSLPKGCWTQCGIRNRAGAKTCSPPQEPKATSVSCPTPQSNTA